MSGRSPAIQSASAASIAPSIQCAFPSKRTRRGDRCVSPLFSKLKGSASRKSCILLGVERGSRVRYSFFVSPDASRVRRFIHSSLPHKKAGAPPRAPRLLRTDYILFERELTATGNKCRERGLRLGDVVAVNEPHDADYDIRADAKHLCGVLHPLIHRCVVRLCMEEHINTAGVASIHRVFNNAVANGGSDNAVPAGALRRGWCRELDDGAERQFTSEVPRTCGDNLWIGVRAARGLKGGVVGLPGDGIICSEGHHIARWRFVF